MNLFRRTVYLAVALLSAISFCSCDLVGQEPRYPSSTSEASASAQTAKPDTGSGPSVEPAVSDDNSTPEVTSEVSPSAPTDSTQAGDTESESSPSAEPSQEPVNTSEVQPEESTATEATPAVTPPAESGVSDFTLSGPAVLTETEDYGQEYVDKMIFLGDSTTYGMKYYAVLSGGKNTTQVWTPSNGTLTLSYQGFAAIVYPPDGSEIPIREAIDREKPEYLVITLGVNGISFMEESYFKSEYKALVTDIQQLSPNTRIILQSIFPVASNYEYLSSINNTKISAANRWVMEVAEETGVKFLNTASVLIGSDGWLPQSYQNGDGLHLNETSFNIVLSYIRTHGYR